MRGEGRETEEEEKATSPRSHVNKMTTASRGNTAGSLSQSHLKEATQNHHPEPLHLRISHWEEKDWTLHLRSLVASPLLVIVRLAEKAACVLSSGHFWRNQGTPCIWSVQPCPQEKAWGLGEVWGWGCSGEKGQQKGSNCSKTSQ